jgi:hypothetical protein
LFRSAKAAAKQKDEGSIQFNNWRATWAHDEQTYHELARTQITLTCTAHMSNEERVELALNFAERKVAILRWEDSRSGLQLHFLVKTGKETEMVRVPVDMIHAGASQLVGDGRRFVAVN